MESQLKQIKWLLALTLLFILVIAASLNPGLTLVAAGVAAVCITGCCLALAASDIAAFFKRRRGRI